MEFPIKNKVLSKTVEETYRYHKEGKSVEEIAELRDLALSTIYGHIASLISNNLLKLEEIVSAFKTKQIIQVIESIDFEGLKDLKEHL